MPVGITDISPKDGSDKELKLLTFYRVNSYRRMLFKLSIEFHLSFNYLKYKY